MHWIGIAPLVFAGIVSIAVATRLLLLARRTRRLPEASMGAGLFLIAVLGQPLAAIGRSPALAGTRAGNLLFGSGIALVVCGVALLHVFTWRVFREGSRLAGAAVAVASLALVACAAGMIHASNQAVRIEDTFPLLRPWALLLVGLIAIAFGWTSVESFLYYRLLKRRLTLALADPVVTNRFLLWALGGSAGALLGVAVAGFMLAGMLVTRHPLALFTMSACGTILSLSWYLAFFPPRAYLRRLRSPA